MALGAVSEATRRMFASPNSESMIPYDTDPRSN